MPQLDAPGFEQIVTLLTPFMETEDERRALVSSLFIGRDNRPDVDFGGAPEAFTRRLIRTLLLFGEINPGEQSLAALLRLIRGRVGLEKQQQIDRSIVTVNSANDPVAEVLRQTPIAPTSTTPSRGTRVSSARILVSYSRADEPFLEQFVELLGEAFPGHTIWYDRKISGGDDWWGRILNEIAACDLFIYLLSNDSLESPYCQAEFREALRLRKLYLGVIVRAKTDLNRTPADLQEAIRHYQWIDMSGGFKDARTNARLYRAVNQQVGAIPAEAPLPHFSQPTPSPVVPDKPKRDPTVWVQILVGIIAAVAVIAAALIGIVPAILNRIDQQAAAQTAEAQTRAAVVPTPFDPQLAASLTIGAIIASWTDTPTPTTMPSPTFIPSETPDFPATINAANTRYWQDASATAAIIASFTKTPVPPSPTAIAAAATLIPAGTSNTVWTPQTQDFNGVTMALVPAGCFTMGSDNGYDDEKPVHEVCLDQPFWIDQTEVTQAQFRSLGGKAANASYFTGDNRPVEQITWFEARDFCAQREGRLPTEAEWEYAARGPESLTYPWGNTFVADNVVYSGNSNNQTANVGSRPGGVSWVGAQDMSGNVWEWVADWYGETYYGNSSRSNPEGPANGTDRVLRGGSWLTDVDYVRAAFRYGGTPDVRYRILGFRCARSYIP